MPGNQCAPMPQDIINGLVESLFQRGQEGFIDVKYYLNDAFSSNNLLYQNVKQNLGRETIDIPIDVKVKDEIRKMFEEITRITDGIFRFHESIGELNKDRTQRIVFQICGSESDIGSYTDNGSAFTRSSVFGKERFGADICLPKEITTWSYEKMAHTLRHESLHAVAGARDLSGYFSTPLGPFFIREIKKSAVPGFCSVLPQRKTVNNIFNMEPRLTNFSDVDQEILRSAANLKEIVDIGSVVRKYHTAFIDEKSYNVFLYSFISEVIRGILSELFKKSNIRSLVLNTGTELTVNLFINMAMYLKGESAILLTLCNILNIFNCLLPFLVNKNTFYTVSVLKTIFPILMFFLMLLEYGVIPTVKQSGQFLIGMMIQVCLSSVARLGAEKATQQLVTYFAGKEHQSPRPLVADLEAAAAPPPKTGSVFAATAN